MTFLNFWVISVFAGYFAILIGIAVVRSRQMREVPLHMAIQIRIGSVWLSFYLIWGRGLGKNGAAGWGQCMRLLLLDSKMLG